MAISVDKVPGGARWTLATDALMSVVIAAGKSLRDVLGQERYDKAWAQIWNELGKSSQQTADALGHRSDDAKSIAEASMSVALLTMGPEVEIELVEATAEKAVLRSTKCPWRNKMKELGIKDALCCVGHLAYFNGFAKSLNPKVTVNLTKAMSRGDSCCEWVFQLEM